MERSDFFCILGIVLLATVFLAPALRPGYTLLPLGLESKIAPWHEQVDQRVKNPLLSDPFYSFYPRRRFLTVSLQQGTYPLWNPYIFGGHPVMADTAAQPFYPLNALAAVFLSAARALPILAWFHLVLTGTSMFAFLRVLGLRRYPTLFGAVAWMLNGNAVVWLENPHRLSTLAWLPLTFLLYELALRQRRLWPAIVAGFSYGLSILGGHTQFALGNGTALAGYALFRTITFSWQERRPVWGPLIVVLIVGLVGVGIGAMQLLPTYQLARLSHRGAVGVPAFLGGRWPPQHIISLWIPDFYGNPVRVPYWGRLNYAEVTVYYGAFTLPLGLAALEWADQALGKFFAGMQIVVLLIALASPLAYLVAWLPWVRYFRLVSLVAYIPFFGSAAAAFGLDALLRGTHQERQMTWGALASALALLVGLTVLIVLNQRPEITARWTDISPQVWRTGLIWLSGIACLLLMRWRSRPGGALLIVLLAGDLLQWGIPFNPVNSLDLLYPENEVTALLQRDSALFRVLALQADRVIFGPNVLSVFGLQETGGYSSLMVERYRDLVKAIDDEVAVWWMRPNRNMLVNSNFSPLFSLLNVKYVLSTRPLDEHLTSLEVAHPARLGLGLSLTSDERITGTFRALHPGLHRVDVEFARLGDAPVGSVRFLLWGEREEGDLVADITVDGEDLPERGAYAFFFAPVKDSVGRTFVWALEASGVEQKAAIAVFQTNKEEAGDGPAFAAYSTQLQLADIRQGVWIYENPNVLPRAYVVDRVEVASGRGLLERLTAADFNPWTTAFLEEPLPADKATSLGSTSGRSSSTARVVQYQPHRVEVEAEMVAPGLLVLSDAYYPGWKVTVDGQPAQLLRANYALRGVVLPGGTHRVVYRFVPRSLQLGLALTGTTLLVGSGLLLRALSHRRFRR